MRTRLSLSLAAAAALATGATAAWADNAQDQKIQELEAKVSALETRQAQNSKDLSATIDGVLRDADRRSQLMATMGDASAGYDNGFFIRAGDGWLLKPGVNFQFRGVADHRSNTAGPKSDETETGFEVRRMQLYLDGTAFTKDLEYHFQWNTRQEGGDFFLEDAWVKYMFADDWGTRAGQFKDPVSHEKLMGDGRLLSVERSLQDAVLGGGYFDRVQGVTLIYGGYSKNNPLNVEIGATDGANSKNTDYTGHSPNGIFDPTVSNVGAAGGHNWDFGVSGRAEYKAMGDWASYRDMSSMGNKADLLVIGAGFDWSQSGDGNAIVGALDAQWENTSGWSVYGSLMVRHLDDGINSSGKDVTDWSGLVQVAYLINPGWEVFARWDGIFYDNDITFSNSNTEDTFHEITVGVAHYFGTNGSAGHRCKVTVDLNWLPNGAPGAIKSAGYLGDSNGDDEVALRAQFQLML